LNKSNPSKLQVGSTVGGSLIDNVKTITKPSDPNLLPSPKLCPVCKIGLSELSV